MPDCYCQSIYDIDLSRLRDKNIDTLLVDLDNTLVPWGGKEVTPELLAWVRAVESQGFKLCMVSNALERRMARFRQLLAIPGVSRAKKPSRRAFRQALAALGSQPDNAAMIGDQIFTDVYGGNRVGLFTILVVPISSEDFLLTRVSRWAERIVLRYLPTSCNRKHEQ